MNLFQIAALGLKNLILSYVTPLNGRSEFAVPLKGLPKLMDMDVAVYVQPSSVLVPQQRRDLADIVVHKLNVESIVETIISKVGLCCPLNARFYSVGAK